MELRERKGRPKSLRKEPLSRQVLNRNQVSTLFALTPLSGRKQGLGAEERFPVLR